MRDLYIFPVVPGYTYTIGIDSDLGFEVAFAFADKGNINRDATNKLNTTYKLKSIRFGQSSLSNPQEVSTLSSLEIAKKEKNQSDSQKPWWYNLVMVVAVPRGLKSSLVVVEGRCKLANEHSVSG